RRARTRTKDAPERSRRGMRHAARRRSLSHTAAYLVEFRGLLARTHRARQRALGQARISAGAGRNRIHPTALRMSRWAPVLLAGASLLVCHAAAAQNNDPSATLDEIVVTGERAGPGLWHVYQGAAQLWIFGTVSPLPKDMTWRSTQLEKIL